MDRSGDGENGPVSACNPCNGSGKLTLEVVAHERIWSGYGTEEMIEMMGRLVGLLR